MRSGRETEGRRPFAGRAIVVGASISGLLAARVVAPHVEQVLVFERDTLGEAAGPRRMTPQGHHLHMLLKGGDEAIERMVPGFLATIERAGGTRVRPGVDFALGSELGFPPKWDSGIVQSVQSRWLLEHCLRRQVLAQTPNVEVRTETTVRGVEYDARLNRIVGVRVEGASEATLETDLVIDATGRGETTLRWLRALGLPLPEIEEVMIDFGYSSAVLELDAAPTRDWLGIGVANIPGPGARGGVVLPIENGLHILSCGGRGASRPPENKDDLIEFSRTLPQPELYETLRRAQFMTPVTPALFPSNRFRHYERLATLPVGLWPIGDAIVSVNPGYGQGMTSAALQCEALSATLIERTDEDIATLGQRFLTRAAEVGLMPWRQANYGDFFYPTTIGDRGMFSDDEMSYRMQVQLAGVRDEEVRTLTTRVGHLLIPFERLMEPDVRARVAAALATSE